MKTRPVFHALFVLTACSMLGLLMAGCPLPILPGSSTTASTGSITGKVLAQGQADNSGVTVTAEPTDGIRSVSTQKAISSRQASKALSAAQAVTDASGAYTLSGMAPGIYTLNAVSRDGAARALTTSVYVGAGSTTQALLMTLMRTGQIQGNVTLRDGSDPTGIVVFIAGTSCSAMTDSSGHYLMSWVPAGTNYTLVMSKVGWVSAIRSTDVAVNRTTSMESVVLEPYVAPQTTGSVFGAVTLGSSPTNAGVFVYLAGTSFISVTDEAGKFNLTGVTPGSYSIVAGKEGFSAQSTTVTVPAGPVGPISFNLAPLGPFFVTYNGNGGTGAVPVDPTAYKLGATVTVIGNSGSLARAGFSFSGWNTQADGGGFTYAPGQTLIMGSSGVVLYAMWTKVITPIDVGGYWDMTTTVGGQSTSMGMVFVRQTGTAVCIWMGFPITGTIEGSSITASGYREEDDGSFTVNLQGTVTESGITGTVNAPEISLQGTFDMTRAPANRFGHLEFQGSWQGVPLSLNTDYGYARPPRVQTDYEFGFDMRPTGVPADFRFVTRELTARSYRVDPNNSGPELINASAWRDGPTINASGGSVNVAAYDGTTIRGDFDLTFPDGSHLYGSFDLNLGSSGTVSAQGTWMGSLIPAAAPVPTTSSKDVRTFSNVELHFESDQLEATLWIGARGVLAAGDYLVPQWAWLSVQWEQLNGSSINAYADQPGYLHITSLTATGIAGSFSTGFSSGGTISGNFNLPFYSR